MARQMDAARRSRIVGCVTAAAALAMLFGQSAFAAAPGTRYGGPESEVASSQPASQDPALAVVAEWNPDEERSAISVAPLDGGEAMAIQESDRHYFYGVAASPSGDSVAYVAQDLTTGRDDLMISSIEGGVARSVVLGATEILGRPTWTPDGRTLALAMDEGDRSGTSVYAVSSDGGPLQELAAPEDYDFEPAFACDIDPLHLFPYEWSPDGSNLLLTVSAPCLEVVFLQVAVVAADGTGLRRIASEGWRSESPDWSPDGQRVVFDREGGELFAVNVDGEGLESLGAGSAAAWGPQGDIASVASRIASEPASYDLALRDAADLHTSEVVSDSPGRVTVPQWSPDGQSIVYISGSERQSDLAVFDLATRTTQPVRRLGAGLLGGFTIAQETPPPSAAAPGDRYGGEERYETAALISQATRPPARNEDGSPASGRAVLVSGEVYPDALTGSYLAGFYDDHFLLTARDQLPSPTIAELDRLSIGEVTIVGGPAAVSPAVEQELRDRGIQVDRTFGEDRYGTAFQVAANREEITGIPAVFLVSGVDFPDALSAGAWAYSSPYPVLLTPPEGLHPQTEEALRQAQPNHIYVVGGPAAVSDEAMRQATMACAEGRERPCRTAQRLAGGTRFSTAIAVADEFSQQKPIAHVNLARGDTFPDALAGTAHSGEEGGTTLFTVSRDKLGAETEAWLREHADTIETVDVYGSDVVISDAVWQQARHAAD